MLGFCGLMLSMSTTEDEFGTVKVQTTRNALTLTQDLDGNLILHCPQNVSENDQSFEVTMTATTEVADDDINEDSITRIQILQNEQLADISPASNDEASAVSRAWFTSKEDKDSLTNKGHRWKQGMWSKEEIAILMSNIDRYLKAHGIKDATEIIFEMSKDERKDFYRTIAWGLNRPLFAVYRRVLRMYDDRNHVGKYTHTEIERLRELRVKHGNDWATIGAALGRSASSVKDRCRLMKETCKTGKWTDEEERRLTDVVHELTGTEAGDIVTQGVSWASVAERVGSRSEKQCRSKWLNYLNWKQSGGTQWTKEDEINLILRIAELGVLDENDINWDILAEGWSSVRSPQWLRSKWWTVKRQIANHKDVSFPASSDSSSPSTEPETLSGGTLQTFEILPSFYLQPSGTTGTFILQTGSSQSLPLTLTSSPGVTLTSNTSPASPEQIIVHALSPEHLLNTSDNVTVHCHTPGIIIRTLASDEISAPLAQTELSSDSDLQQNDLQNGQSSLETDSLSPEVQHTDINVSHDSLYCNEQSLKMRVRNNMKLQQHPAANDEDISGANIKSDDRHIDLAENYVKEDLGPSALEEQVDQPAVEGTVLIVPSCHGYIQTDDIDGESVLPLTTFADPILQHHRDRSHHIDSSIDGPDSDDLKDVEDL
ncbi:cyclin-D-binding Myb-like transcription factor 1 isoform X4 [Mixophyes fleayi]|uniref:cyclin-D-binding Myb-like transcription factor 1 isoform X4 n=1 Tax=Mixophyes fleayi TaxID=3061075 RepID=UPI003F4DACA3